MSIIITGCSSYIGGYIARHLLGRGFAVTGISRTDPLICHDNFIWINADMRSAVEASLCPSASFLVHTAANSTLGLDAKEYAEANIITTLNARKLAEQLRAKGVIYTSSMMVYGSSEGSISESSPIINPDPYGETKHTGESILNGSDIPCISLRLCGVLGNGSKGWIASICRKLVQNEKIEFYDSPFNNLVHVSDVAEITEYFINNPSDKNRCLNTAARGMSTSAQIVELLKDRLGSSSELCAGKKQFPVIDASELFKIYTTMTIEESLEEYLKDTGLLKL